jgi:subtilase family serine protease
MRRAKAICACLTPLFSEHLSGKEFPRCAKGIAILNNRKSYMVLHQKLSRGSGALAKGSARRLKTLSHGRLNHPLRSAGNAIQPLVCEVLEPRQFLSATPGIQPTVTYLRNDLVQPAASSSSVPGYSPAEIADAYGFDKISFNNGTIAGDGTGQTIAIVDAYNDPNLSKDLSVFDQHFGLSAPTSFKIVSQTGSRVLPTTDPGWAAEISLDVEWAHAMAPKAGILLVEANSATNTDLLDAVKYASKAAGVSVVSMSWGGSEFVSYTGSESAGERVLDKTFQTPPKHTAVTFIASAGDSGFANGVQWPASSPNVLSVGGTTLASDGNRSDETAWRGFAEGTSGGFSKYELEPGYQRVAQQSGYRSDPDVAYDADPDTGFAVYDSLLYNGQSGWQVVGGTSAGAPQWAALIAIADQGRALAGKGTLDGASQTLPALYSVYSAPGTSGYATYTSYFNPIVSGGFGISTGLGSPKAAAIVGLLEDYTSSASGPTASPVSISLVTSPPSSVVSGSAGTIKVRLTNTNGTPFAGTMTVKVYASADSTLSSDDTILATLALGKVKLPPLGSKVVTLKLKYPLAMSAGSYDLIASATATGDAPTQAVSAAPVAVVQPVVDLATTFASGSPITVTPGKGENVKVTITNDGNYTATGTVSLNLYESADQMLDVADQLLAVISGHKISIAAKRSITLPVHFVAPAGLAVGTYNLIVSTTSKTNPADTNTSNDVAVLPTA